MSSREHQRAAELATQAAGMAKQGQCTKARALYQKAAVWERKALQHVPADKARTRGILGISLASLLYKAGDLVGAEQTARALLSAADLEPPARRELDSMLRTIENHPAEKASEQLSSPP